MAPAGIGRPMHLSAASGLVAIGAHLYVVADDELHLGVFPLQSTGAGHLMRLFPGTLPAAPAARKASKPDLEALAVLPPFPSYPHGALFALGSGSTARRRTGALVALDAQGGMRGTPRLCDLSNLFSGLDARFAALNIEGAVVVGGELCLLQRGSRHDARNAIIRFDLYSVLEALRSGQPIAPLALHAFELGDIEGIPLSFTDGAALPGGDIVFSAVAEDSPDNYHDGPCAGAAIGIATRAGTLACLERLEGCHKIEGIDANVHNDVISLLLVTDADDADVPASLFAAAIGTKEPGQLHCGPVRRPV